MSRAGFDIGHQYSTRSPELMGQMFSILRLLLEHGATPMEIYERVNNPAGLTVGIRATGVPNWDDMYQSIRSRGHENEITNLKASRRKYLIAKWRRASFRAGRIVLHLQAAIYEPDGRGYKRARDEFEATAAM